MAIQIGDKKLKTITYNDRFLSLLHSGEKKLFNYETTKTRDDVINGIVNFGDGQIIDDSVNGVPNSIKIQHISYDRKRFHIKSKNAIDGVTIPFYDRDFDTITIRLKESLTNETKLKIVVYTNETYFTISSFLGENELNKEIRFDSSYPGVYRQIDIYQYPSYTNYNFLATVSKVGESGVTNLFNTYSKNIKNATPMYFDIECESRRTGVASAGYLCLGNYSQCTDLQQINY